VRGRRSDPKALAAHLDALVASTDRVARRENDPVGFAHSYPSTDDREVAALVAALLAFGNVVAIRKSVARALTAIGPSPAATVDAEDEARLEARLRGFVHRVYRGPDLARVLAGAGALRRAHGSIGAALVVLRARVPEDEPDPMRATLTAFADALRGPKNGSRGLGHLVPDPRKGSACKRLLLYLRWMVRPADGVDLGLSALDPAELVMPLDTHIHRIGRNLALTRRKDASYATAREVTDALRALDAHDPVKYDFALCHLGVSRACPSRRDPKKCEGCVLRPVCRHWSR
jgi:uncharacterized protein (TIGR02757 family)